jgi:hypothetical protein
MIMTVFLLLSDLPARQVTHLGGRRITVTAILLDLVCEGYRLTRMDSL